MMRHLKPAGLVLAALAACTEFPDPDQAPRLVATVHQFGPVGYRDPLGIISPDGRSLVTAANHVLQVRPLDGGEPRLLPSGTARITHLIWHPDGRLVVGQREDGVTWWTVDVERGTRAALWPAGATLRAADGTEVRAEALRDLAWSPGGRLAAVASRVWTMEPGGAIKASQPMTAVLSHPVWLDDERLACLVLTGERQQLTLPCGEQPVTRSEPLDAFGPITAFGGDTLYFASPNDSGFVDLRLWDLVVGAGRVVATFPRDAYAPSVSRDGTVLFKVQDYFTQVAVMPAEGGEFTIRTAFQAETPSWSPDGASLGITYGTWRRVVDDFRYPDIAQEAGIIPADGPAPLDQVPQVVEASVSEDQGLAWSPNRRWIAFHSHQQQSDDIWLRPADGSSPPRRITFLGRGAEVGWPRWSPDGRWIVFNGDTEVQGVRRSALWVIGVDQATGRVTHEAQVTDLEGVAADVLHTEWLGGSDMIVFNAFEPPIGHTLYRVARAGGRPEVLHRYESTQRFDGFGASPDGTWLVYPAPDSAGRLQLWRVDVAPGAMPVQLTRDSTEKTQPSVSPDGRRIAFTVWRYDVRFYTLTP